MGPQRHGAAIRDNPVMIELKRRVRGRWPRGEFGRAVTTLVLGTGASQAIVIATSPVLTRLYSPVDYGVFAVAGSIVSVLATVTCLRYEYALPLPKDDIAGANVLALSLLINGAMSLAAALILWLLAPTLLPIFGATALIPFVWVISIGQFGGGIVSALTNWAVRTKSFGEIAATRLTQGLALVTVQIGLGLTGAGSVGLIVGDTAGRIAGSTRLARVAWKTHRLAFRQVSRAGILAGASRYRRFPIYSMPSALLATFATQTPLLLMIVAYGPEAGGYFALAARICAIPLTLIANAVGHVFVAQSATLMQEDPAALKGLFKRTTMSLAKTATIPAVMGMIAAPLFSGLVFGSDWAPAGTFVAILIPSYLLQFVIAATGDVLYVVERQDLQVVREILRFTLLGLAVPVAAWLGLPAIQAIVLLSAAGILNYALYGLITWKAISIRSVRPAAR